MQIKKKLKRNNKYVAISNLSVFYTWKNIKKLYKTNKFKQSTPTWNDKLKLPDRLHSVSDIQDYFEYIIKMYEKLANSPSVRMYIENWIAFITKTENHFELVIPKAKKLVGSTEEKKSKDGANVPH